MEAVLDQPVLVLNRLWQAVNVIGARRAFALLARGHANVVHHYDDDFRTFSMLDWIDFSQHNPPLSAVETVRTPSRTIRLPRVILLTFFDKLPCKEVKLTRNANGQHLDGEVPLDYPLRPGDTVVVKVRWF